MFENTESLLKQIALGEDSVLEFKTIKFKGERVSVLHRDSMADELAAMANTASGVLVLGVEDRSRRIVGLPMESERLSGRKPEYRLLDEVELKLTIYAAKCPHDSIAV